MSDSTIDAVKEKAAIHATMLENRQYYEPDMESIQEYVLPARGMFLNKGDTITKAPDYQSIIDGSGTRSFRNLAAGMQGGLTSPSRKWFRLGTTDQDLGNHGAVRDWLDRAEATVYAVLRKSNFYTAAHSVYEELGFGTAAMLTLEDPERTVHFHTMTAGQFCIDIDANGRVNRLSRDLWMSAAMLRDMFGEEKLSQEVKDHLTRTGVGGHIRPLSRFRVTHMIDPREDRNPGQAIPSQMPWASTWWEYGKAEQFLRESGFVEKPFAAPRWLGTGGRIWGVGPLHDVLGDIMMLQEERSALLEALQKVNQPPMMTPTAFAKLVNTIPDGINTVDPTSADAMKPLYQIRPDIGAMVQEIQDLRAQIREGLYNDLFLMLNQPHMTATEVAERHEEKLLMLGPVIERLLNEFLDTVLQRVFGVCFRNGLIPPPPEEVMENGMKIEYISLLAQAQKLVGTYAVNSLFGFVAGVAQVQGATGQYPEALDVVDFDEQVRSFAGMVGTPANHVRSTEDVDRIREARAKAMAAAQQQAAAAQQASVAKDLAGADMEGKNALTELKRSVQPA
jgi:hypothetical protein